MLFACSADDPAEGEVGGTRHDLRDLAAVLRAGHGWIACRTGLDPSPYDHVMGGISVHATAAQEPAGFVLLADRSELRVVGGKESLQALADSIDGLALEGRDGEHWHVEHYPGHPYLAADSYPVVISLD